MRLLYLLIVILIVSSCNPAKQESNQKKFNHYAEGFHIQKKGEITQIDVFDPWENAEGMSYSYYLIPKTSEIPDSLLNANIIRTPVERVVCLSTTHIGFLDNLDVINKIVGVSGKQYVTNQAVKKQIDNGVIQDVGYDQNLNYELLLQMKPDLVIAYGVGSEVVSYINKLKDLKIPVFINAEYLERTPLGRAEWLKVIGSFFDLQEKAQQNFTAIEKEYTDLQKMALEAKFKPVVMTGLPYKENWWIPGGDSYMSNLIHDAGGVYLWGDNDKRESFVISLENVIVKSVTADYWINCGYATSISDIKSMDERFSVISPLKNNKIFNDNKRALANGGNDVWETGVVKPQIILKDLIQIFHPEIFDASSLYYYQQLGE